MRTGGVPPLLVAQLLMFPVDWVGGTLGNNMLRGVMPSTKAAGVGFRQALRVVRGHV